MSNKHNQKPKTIIKAQEALLANSVKDLKQALALLNHLVRGKRQNLQPKANYKAVGEVGDQGMNHRIETSDANPAIADRSSNRESCSRSFTLH